MIAIKIESTYLDTFPDMERGFYITRQQRDLRGWEQRNSDYTRSIDIPRTPNNNVIIIPYIQDGVQEIHGSIEIDGMTLDFDTIFTVTGYSDRFNLKVVFDNQKLFNKIQGQIKELDFDDLSFIWNTAGINGIKNTTDIVFALAIWHSKESYNFVRQGGGNDWHTIAHNIYNSGFFIYCKELFDRVIQRAGFTLDVSNVSNNDLFNNTAIPCPVDKFLDPDEITINDEEVSTGSDANYSTSESRISFDTVVTGGSSYWDNVTDTEYDFTVDGFIQVNAYIDGTVLDQNRSGFVPPFIRLRRNETTIRQYDTKRWPKSISEGVYVVSGDELYFDIFWDDGNNEGVKIDSGSWFKISSYIQDTTIDVANFLPEIGQADFIRGVLNHTNLILTINEDNVVLYDFDNIFINDEYNLQLVDDRPKQTEFTFPNLFQVSKLKYKDPPAPLDRSDMDYFFNVNDDTLPDEGIVMELPFEACDISNNQLYGSGGSKQLAFIDAYNLEMEVGETITVTSGSTGITLSTATQFNPLAFFITAGNHIRQVSVRTSSTSGSAAASWNANESGVEYQYIKIVKKRRPVKIVYIDDADGNFDIWSTSSDTTQTITSGKKATFGENMLLGNISQYNTLMESMRYPKFLQVWVKIPNYQFFQKDLLRRIVYIDKFNEKYWINKLDQWNPDTQICRAELIRLR